MKHSVDKHLTLTGKSMKRSAFREVVIEIIEKI
jgi:hypothetical protein